MSARGRSNAGKVRKYTAAKGVGKMVLQCLQICFLLSHMEGCYLLLE